MSESRRLSIINTSLFLLSGVGLVLSIYGYYVEFKLEQEEDYTALCDINEHVSCTKVFKSTYAKGFGISSEESIFNVPNSLYGIPFYSLLAVLSYSSSLTINKILISNVTVANCLTPYLAYLLTFVLHDVCIVCISIYIVNALLLLMAFKKQKLLKSTVKDVKNVKLKRK
ncbi:hypothetical protein WA026_002054 [Henosepilachna vigintioctopunctata]|uniref:vitamin-K-epoxide reductase (warfarin-sensitive) n=1 Tax=Henosepilachna vigintioctopunctata TaxID=420089 RepID=A0AAW1UJR5_9CUCU